MAGQRHQILGPCQAVFSHAFGRDGSRPGQRAARSRSTGLQTVGSTAVKPGRVGADAPRVALPGREAQVGPLLSWVALASALGAVFVVGRWLIRGRRDSLGSTVGFPRITVVALLVLSAVATYPGILHRRQESRLGAVASAIAGTRVQVKCQTLSSASVDVGAEAGYVKWGPNGVPEHVAHIKWQQCNLLRDYQNSDKHHPSEGEYIAVHVLTHESVHTSGVRSERLTECAAVQRDAMTARLLGASSHDARTLARLYWLVVYPRMPDDYRDAGCRPGGALDEKLPTSPWAAVQRDARPVPGA